MIKKNFRAQVWIETAIYTLIGLTIIFIVIFGALDIQVKSAVPMTAVPVYPLSLIVFSPGIKQLSKYHHQYYILFHLSLHISYYEKYLKIHKSLLFIH